jgi:predicted nucleic acid-binding protein
MIWLIPKKILPPSSIKYIGWFVTIFDEERARRAAKNVGLSVAGSIAILEHGARLKRVTDLRAVYLRLLDQGIRFDYNLLEARLGDWGLRS